jgi:hypothetical protein
MKACEHSDVAVRPKVHVKCEKLSCDQSEGRTPDLTWFHLTVLDGWWCLKEHWKCITVEHSFGNCEPTTSTMNVRSAPRLCDICLCSDMLVQLPVAM